MRNCCLQAEKLPVKRAARPSALGLLSVALLPMVLLAASCQERPKVSSDDVGISGLFDGAVVSDGSHDVVLVVHHHSDYSQKEIEVQVEAAVAATAWLRELSELAHQAGRSRPALSIVAVGEEARILLPLSTRVEGWGNALDVLAKLSAVGRASLESGLDMALDELEGRGARRGALPLVMHFGWRGDKVSKDWLLRAERAGAQLLQVGAKDPELVKDDAPHVHFLRLSAEDDFHARMEGLLALYHSPLNIQVSDRSEQGLHAGLHVVDAEGEALKVEPAEARKQLQATVEWAPASQGRRLDIRGQLSDSLGVLAERKIRATVLPQSRLPVILSVSPEMASPGETVVFEGRFFSTTDDGNEVVFGSVKAPAKTLSKTRLEVVVPVGAQDEGPYVLADGFQSEASALRIDSDSDGLPDRDEMALGTDPFNPDTDGDGVGDLEDACPTELAGAGNVDESGCTLCGNGIQDGNESDLDCGGGCSPHFLCKVDESCTVGEDCTSGACHEGVCLADTCTDGQLSGDELEVDCGGSCAPCKPGSRCELDSDCSPGTCELLVCRAETCSNGVLDPGETDVDCGGACAPCANGEGCSSGLDCSSGVCESGSCAVPRCEDGVQNGTETDVDCGGECAQCSTGNSCQVNDDCLSRVCSNGLCLAATCSDGVRNGTETDVDCGGDCGPCAPGNRCMSNSHCSSENCVNNTCAQPTCLDNVENGNETDVDCGGSCDTCGLGKRCSENDDCDSGNCTQGICRLPTCQNDVFDGDESDVDCGGSCPGCAPGRICRVDSDCASLRCDEGTLQCLDPECDDGLLNGDESDVDCGGSCSDRCVATQMCNSPSDCESGVCTEGVCQQASCSDGVQNQDETDVDCGGSCGPCGLELSCKADSDCESGDCFESQCVAPSCEDGRTNGAESDVDCGGPDCAPCGDLKLCQDDDDCDSLHCGLQDGAEPEDPKVCLPATCDDNIRNGGEGDVDCGGPCSPCENGSSCTGNSDCSSLVCQLSGDEGVCLEPTCDDGVTNAGESDVDCGGDTSCQRCPDLALCAEPSDCASGVCGLVNGELRCQHPSCFDGVANGEESGVDCGGPDCSKCSDGLACNADSDCISGVCDAGLCAEPSCSDNVRNGNETDIDCGGDCDPCGESLLCEGPEDCLSMVCSGDPRSCAFAACNDGVRNGDETDVDCGGPCDSCGHELRCILDDDCQSGICEGGTCAVPSCTDLVKNGDESDVDCGGSCAVCELGQSCNDASDCASGVCGKGVCVPDTCSNGVLDGDETDVDCGGSCGACGNERRCFESGDCQSLFCEQSFCADARSCRQLHEANPGLASGVRSIRPEGQSQAIEVFCDLDTDDGGWTLVGSAVGALVDAASGYHDNLASLSPDSPGVHGVWAGMRDTVGLRFADLRFVCDTRGHWPHESTPTVDISFYSVDWFQEITQGSDADSCFLVDDGSPFYTPVRRDNTTGQVEERPYQGGSRQQGEEDGRLVGESSCGALGDFTVDLRDSGMGGSLDGTDWGADSGLAKCGDVHAPDAAYFLFVRESLAHCSNGELDAELGEVNVDCGGPCAPCPTFCEEDFECESERCVHSLCAPSRCDDGRQNGDETDVDCGGSCGGCEDMNVCESNSDCLSDFCDSGICRTPACRNGLADGDETDVDCGGSECAACGIGKACIDASDCESEACFGGVCITDPCMDGQQSPGETDVDCGGPSCDACVGGKTCLEDSDCESQACDAGVCRVLSSCSDLLDIDAEHESGRYTLQVPDGSGSYVAYCDMDNDGGGWTLVGATRNIPLRDEVSNYHSDLGRQIPLGTNLGVWGAFRGSEDQRHDLRFTCRPHVSSTENAVDLSYYGTELYRIITSGSDEQTCTSTPSNPIHPPKRRDHILGRERDRGELFRGGNLVAEDSCGDVADFAVDFDGGGMAGDHQDGTGWGSADAQSRCGGPVSSGQGVWWLWVRDLAPECHDGVKNGDESDMDCGGSCGPCAGGSVCEADLDCEEGVCSEGVCRSSSCRNGIKDNDESDVDCGGSCGSCELGGSCNIDSDCESSTCVNGSCLAATCRNNVQDGDETGLDCGGSCAPCSIDEGCNIDSDCQSGICGANGCAADRCSDGMLSPGETAIDCGGPSCAPCEGGKSCLYPSDCESRVCNNGVCGKIHACEELVGRDLVTSGAYTLELTEGAQKVYCDMDADGGGWTLVAASRALPPQDVRGSWHEDLAQQFPGGHQRGILGDIAGSSEFHDLRFVCTDQSGSPAVDLVFYRTAWYRELTRGSDADSCLYVSPETQESPVFRRKDLLSNELRQRGQAYSSASGHLRAENQCDDEDVFVVDFDSGGLENPVFESGSTSWGEINGEAYCGGLVPEGEGEFWIYVRSVSPSCSDGILNGDETDIDCGGSCGPCRRGNTCELDEDCLSGGCHESRCLPEHCTNKVQDANESDLDCGGPCAPCAFEQSCNGSSDCQDGLLCLDSAAAGEAADTRCYAAHCANGIMDADEDDIDCGGSSCPVCVDIPCDEDEDCGFGRICEDQICRTDHCSDFRLNGDETDVDCGGSCGPCLGGQLCEGPQDCDTQMCEPSSEPGVQRCRVLDSCSDLFDAGISLPSGAYFLKAEILSPGVDEEPDELVELAPVWCDMSTDGGGWTLVANSRGKPVKDQGGNWTIDLMSSSPMESPDPDWEGTQSIWDQLSGLASLHDVRFTCRRDAEAEQNDVDLVFYGTDLYRLATESENDALTCSWPLSNPPSTSAPRRRNLASSPVEELRRGTYWNGSWLAAENFCNDPDSFVVDFSQGGLNGPLSSVTSWGEANGELYCGQKLASGADALWSIWVRLPSCTDGIQNGNESDVDCGGSCAPCGFEQMCDSNTDCAGTLECSSDNLCLRPVGESCAENTECHSGVCQEGSCRIATCGDIYTNGNETDLNCGGADCAACGLEQSCAESSDCSGSLVCEGGKCLQPLGESCSANSQCASGTCDGSDGICRLNAGDSCSSDNECVSNYCMGGFCRVLVGESCEAHIECETDLCHSNICRIPLGESGCGTQSSLCERGSCHSDTCLLDLGESCNSNDECASGICDGTCEDE